MCMPNIMEKQLFLFECFPKYIVVAKFLIFNILTNRTILIHYQFVWESFISTWTINFEPGSIWIKLVFEEINLLNFFLTAILDLHNFTMTGVDLYLSKLWLISITISSLLVLLIIKTAKGLVPPISVVILFTFSITEPILFRYLPPTITKKQLLGKSKVNFNSSSGVVAICGIDNSISK